MKLTSLPPLSLYVHIPWCVRKCPYCDFNSHQAGQSIPEQEYVAALLEDFEVDAHLAQGREIRSVFFGGGTPSLFSPQAIAAILEHINAKVSFSQDVEITLEANPGTVEQDKFIGFRKAGVNRLSIGIQSFDEHCLQQLGRIHDGKDAIRAVESAQRANFNSINLDLMHGLPQQNSQHALADLRQALQLGPQHLSWYQLTIEPNTAFYKNPPMLPLEDELATIEEQGVDFLQAHGYDQYEVSAYCRPSFEARHNINYWEFGDYFGIGAGAHSKMTILETQQVMRKQKTRLPQHYMDRSERRREQWSNVEPSQLILEFMMNALRLNRGVPSAWFTQRTGLARQSLEPLLQQSQQKGLLHANADLIQATPLGRKFLNDLLDVFVPNMETGT